MLRKKANTFFKYDIRNIAKTKIFIYLFFVYILLFISAGQVSGDKLEFNEIYTWNLGVLKNVIFIHTITYLLGLNRIFNFECYDIHLIVKSKNRIQLLTRYICIILFWSITYVLLAGLVAWVQSGFTISFNKEWTNFLIFNYTQLYLSSTVSLQELMSSLTVNSILYFIATGLMDLLLIRILNSKAFAFFTICMINIGGYICYLCRIEYTFRFLFLGNLIPGLDTIKHNATINWYYWISVLIVLIGSCLIIFKYKDFGKINGGNKNT